MSRLEQSDFLRTPCPTNTTIVSSRFFEGVPDDLDDDPELNTTAATTTPPRRPGGMRGKNIFATTHAPNTHKGFTSASIPDDLAEPIARTRQSIHYAGNARRPVGLGGVKRRISSQLTTRHTIKPAVLVKRSELENTRPSVHPSVVSASKSKAQTPHTSVIPAPVAQKTHTTASKVGMPKRGPLREAKSLVDGQLDTGRKRLTLSGKAELGHGGEHHGTTIKRVFGETKDANVAPVQHVDPAREKGKPITRVTIALEKKPSEKKPSEMKPLEKKQVEKKPLGKVIQKRSLADNHGPEQQENASKLLSQAEYSRLTLLQLGEKLLGGRRKTGADAALKPWKPLGDIVRKRSLVGYDHHDTHEQQETAYKNMETDDTFRFIKRTKRDAGDPVVSLHSPQNGNDEKPLDPLMNSGSLTTIHTKGPIRRMKRDSVESIVSLHSLQGSDDEELSGPPADIRRPTTTSTSQPIRRMRRDSVESVVSLHSLQDSDDEEPSAHPVSVHPADPRRPIRRVRRDSGESVVSLHSLQDSDDEELSEPPAALRRPTTTDTSQPIRWMRRDSGNSVVSLHSMQDSDREEPSEHPVNPRRPIRRMKRDSGESVVSLHSLHSLQDSEDEELSETPTTTNRRRPIRMMERDSGYSRVSLDSLPFEEDGGSLEHTSDIRRHTVARRHSPEQKEDTNKTGIIKTLRNIGREARNSEYSPASLDNLPDESELSDFRADSCRPTTGTLRLNNKTKRDSGFSRISLDSLPDNDDGELSDRPEYDRKPMNKTLQFIGKAKRNIGGQRVPPQSLPGEEEDGPFEPPMNLLQSINKETEYSEGYSSPLEILSDDDEDELSDLWMNIGRSTTTNTQRPTKATRVSEVSSASLEFLSDDDKVERSELQADVRRHTANRLRPINKAKRDSRVSPTSPENLPDSSDDEGDLVDLLANIQVRRPAAARSHANLIITKDFGG